jgi:hypothetical protein
LQDRVVDADRVPSLLVCRDEEEIGLFCRHRRVRFDVRMELREVEIDAGSPYCQGLGKQGDRSMENACHRF